MGLEDLTPLRHVPSVKSQPQWPRTLREQRREAWNRHLSVASPLEIAVLGVSLKLLRCAVSRHAVGLPAVARRKVSTIKLHQTSIREFSDMVEQCAASLVSEGYIVGVSLDYTTLTLTIAPSEQIPNSHASHWHPKTFSMLGLHEELETLSESGKEVVAATKRLMSEISHGIDSYSLMNGSHVKTNVFDDLTAEQRRRVIDKVVGRYYERAATLSQFVVLWDTQQESLVIINRQLSPEYIPITRIKRDAARLN